VIVLQTLHGLSDREATEALTFDLRWKAACGPAVTDPGFHPTTLTYWRRRLARSGHGDCQLAAAFPSPKLLIIRVRQQERGPLQSEEDFRYRVGT
jgi:Transposase domain (DUF772)